MNEIETTEPGEAQEKGLGADFPGAMGGVLLRWLLPADRREECVGDLIEEAETHVLPRRGQRAARRWFWWQAVSSASPMHARRWAREIGMHRQRWLVVSAVLVLGPLMVLDGGIRTAPLFAIGLATAAVLIPATVGLLSGNLRVHATAAIASTLLLIAARLTSGIELRWYAIPWIFYILLYANWRYEHGVVGSGGNGPAGRHTAV